MVLYDAEIDLAERSQAGFSGHLITAERKQELLLVHSGRRQQRGFDALFEPLGSIFCPANRGSVLGLVRRSLRRAVANGNHHDELFSVCDFENVGNLLERQSHPAGVESQRLRRKNDLLACRTENLPEKEKWNRADFAFSARFPRQKRHFQAKNVQKIHVPEHHTILRFAAYLFLAQGSPGLRTTTGAANLEATKPYYNGGIQNGQVHF